MQKLVKASEGFSGAEIEEVVMKPYLMLMRTDKKIFKCKTY